MAVVASAVTCLSLFGVLLYNMIATAPTSAIALGITLAGSVVFEIVYRRKTGRTFRRILARPIRHRQVLPLWLNEHRWLRFVAARLASSPDGVLNRSWLFLPVIGCGGTEGWMRT